MYVGDIETKQLISITLMIIFALAVMFFLGYKMAYDNAIKYANEQIEEKTENFRVNYGIVEGDLDYLLGNIPNLEGSEDEKE